jgi:S1-C subfamily serine protease
MRAWSGWLAAAAGCLAICGFGSGPVVAQEQAETSFRDARHYTVRIRTQVTTPFIEDDLGAFTGAGFLVDSTRGWVLTNAHVVGRSPSDVTVAFAGGEFRPARKIYVDSFTDMAVLEVSAADRRHPVAPIECARVPEVGETVGAFGHPLGMPFTGSRGIVSGRTDQFLNDLLQIDATVDPGNSGGPVIALRSGQVVGIATAKAGDSKVDRLNFATPMKDVCRILSLLRDGISPEPPELTFSFLVDEDNRHTLQVGDTDDTARWPFRPGDRVLSVGTGGEAVTTVTQFVTALRGKTSGVPIRIMRGGRELDVVARPNPRHSVVGRRGMVLDGALIAPFTIEDASPLTRSARLIVHSVEPGSAAQSLGMSAMDIIESIDGRRFADLDSLLGYLHGHEDGVTLRVVFRRFSPSYNRWFDLHVRDLPGAEKRLIGPDARLAGGAR